MSIGSGYLHREDSRTLLRLVEQPRGSGPGRDRGAIGEPSERAGDQSGGVVGSVLTIPHEHGPACRKPRRSQRTVAKRSSASSVLALSVSLPPKLCVTAAQTEHMPFYLREFFRVLSSWVHRSCSRSLRRG